MADKSTAIVKRELRTLIQLCEGIPPSISLQLMSKEEARSCGEGAKLPYTNCVLRRIPLTKSFATTPLMKHLPGMLLGLGLAALPLWAVPQSDNALQTTATVTPSAAEAPGIPHLVRFTGVIRDTAGKPVTGTVNLTFSFYTEERGGTAIWSESQNVTLNNQGHYTVLLGASESSGLPADLFNHNQVRWVGVQARLPDAAENPRVLLTDVPFALKAADSETLGGKPASAYVTTDA